MTATPRGPSPRRSRRPRITRSVPTRDSHCPPTERSWPSWPRIRVGRRRSGSVRLTCSRPRASTAPMADRSRSGLRTAPRSASSHEDSFTSPSCARAPTARSAPLHDRVAEPGRRAEPSCIPPTSSVCRCTRCPRRAARARSSRAIGPASSTIGGRSPFPTDGTCCSATFAGTPGWWWTSRRERCARCASRGTRSRSRPRTGCSSVTWRDLSETRDPCSRSHSTWSRCGQPASRASSSIASAVSRGSRDTARRHGCSCRRVPATARGRWCG
jgi:hypothetical protein